MTTLKSDKNYLTSVLLFKGVSASAVVCI